MAQLFHKSSYVSDHCSLLLTLFDKKKRGRHKKGFKFEAMWVQDPRCESIVSLAWSEGLDDNSPYHFLTCLNSCKSKLEAWNRSEFGRVGKEVARLQKQLEWLKLQPTDASVIQRIRETRSELNCWLEKESLMW